MRALQADREKEWVGWNMECAAELTMMGRRVMGRGKVTDADEL